MTATNNLSLAEQLTKEYGAPEDSPLFRAERYTQRMISGLTAQVVELDFARLSKDLLAMVKEREALLKEISEITGDTFFHVAPVQALLSFLEFKVGVSKKTLSPLSSQINPRFKNDPLCVEDSKIFETLEACHPVVGKVKELNERNHRYANLLSAVISGGTTSPLLKQLSPMTRPSTLVQMKETEVRMVLAYLEQDPHVLLKVSRDWEKYKHPFPGTLKTAKVLTTRVNSPLYIKDEYRPYLKLPKAASYLKVQTFVPRFDVEGYYEAYLLATIFPDDLFWMYAIDNPLGVLDFLVQKWTGYHRSDLPAERYAELRLWTRSVLQEGLLSEYAIPFMELLNDPQVEAIPRGAFRRMVEYYKRRQEVQKLVDKGKHPKSYLDPTQHLSDHTLTKEALLSQFHSLFNLSLGSKVMSFIPLQDALMVRNDSRGYSHDVFFAAVNASLPKGWPSIRLAFSNMPWG